MLAIKYKDEYYQFKPTWLGGILTLVCIAVFIKLGMWQYNKAQLKIEAQSVYQDLENNRRQEFPLHRTNIEDAANDLWKHKHVRVRGEYATQYQLLLDNQVSNSKAGFHVITPLKIAGSDEYVLVNRGWIAGNSTHTNTPTVETPSGQVDIEGVVWLPSKRFFTLDTAQATASFETVWQYLNMQEYQKKVPIKVSALVIKLDKEVTSAGGFVREWEVPQSRIVTHLGYAYQWFGFAVAALLIFIFISFVKVRGQ